MEYIAIGVPGHETRALGGESWSTVLLGRRGVVAGGHAGGDACLAPTLRPVYSLLGRVVLLFGDRNEFTLLQVLRRAALRLARPLLRWMRRPHPGHSSPRATASSILHGLREAAHRSAASILHGLWRNDG